MVDNPHLPPGFAAHIAALEAEFTERYLPPGFVARMDMNPTLTPEEPETYATQDNLDHLGHASEGEAEPDR